MPQHRERGFGQRARRPCSVRAIASATPVALGSAQSSCNPPSRHASDERAQQPIAQRRGAQRCWTSHASIRRGAERRADQVHREQDRERVHRVLGDLAQRRARPALRSRSRAGRCGQQRAARRLAAFAVVRGARPELDGRGEQHSAAARRTADSAPRTRRRCATRPNVGTSQNAAASTPSTAPNVLPAYSAAIDAPARRTCARARAPSPAAWRPSRRSPAAAAGTCRRTPRPSATPAMAARPISASSHSRPGRARSASTSSRRRSTASHAAYQRAGARAALDACRRAPARRARDRRRTPRRRRARPPIRGRARARSAASRRSDSRGRRSRTTTISASASRRRRAATRESVAKNAGAFSYAARRSAAEGDRVAPGVEARVGIALNAS